MKLFEEAMEKTLKDLRNKLKADNIRPEVKKGLKLKIKMLEGGKTVTK